VIHHPPFYAVRPNISNYADVRIRQSGGVMPSIFYTTSNGKMVVMTKENGPAYFKIALPYQLE
jgi:hypothetical protein